MIKKHYSQYVLNFELSCRISKLSPTKGTKDAGVYLKPNRKPLEFSSKLKDVVKLSNSDNSDAQVLFRDQFIELFFSSCKVTDIGTVK